MPGQVWRSWKDWTAGCRCGMKGASSLPKRRPSVRYFSATATGVPQVLLSQPPVSAAWANTGQQLSNRWTQWQRTRTATVRSLTAWSEPTSPKPPPRTSRPSSRGRGGSRSGKPGARGCRFERLSGNWEFTGAQSRNTWRSRVPRRDNVRWSPQRRHLIPSRPDRVTFLPAT